MDNVLNGKPFFCSWSGGKDSCLALHRAIQQGGKPACLITMMNETGRKSRSHGLPQTLLEKQAAFLGIPVHFHAATWDNYEETFLEALRQMKDRNINHGVFGDIDLEPHREWVHRVCGTVDIVPIHPIWQEGRQDLLNEFMQLGFRSRIVVLNESRLAPEFLGREINPATVADLEAAGVDACGEEGEFHTVVTNGPLFRRELFLQEKARLQHEGYLFLDLDVTTA